MIRKLLLLLALFVFSLAAYAVFLQVYAGQGKGASKPKISLAQAIKTVQSQVKAQITKAELRLDEGKQVFKFRLRGVIVNAETGKIIERPAPKVSLPQAIKTAQEKAKVGGVVTEIELEYDDGKLVCEVDIAKGEKGYEVQIDAATGAILKVEEQEEDGDKG